MIKEYNRLKQRAQAAKAYYEKLYSYGDTNAATLVSARERAFLAEGRVVYMQRKYPYLVVIGTIDTPQKSDTIGTNEERV